MPPADVGVGARRARRRRRRNRAVVRRLRRAADQHVEVAQVVLVGRRRDAGHCAGAGVGGRPRARAEGRRRRAGLLGQPLRLLDDAAREGAHLARLRRNDAGPRGGRVFGRAPTLPPALFGVSQYELGCARSGRPAGRRGDPKFRNTLSRCSSDAESRTSPSSAARAGSVDSAQPSRLLLLSRSSSKADEGRSCDGGGCSGMVRRAREGAPRRDVVQVDLAHSRTCPRRPGAPRGASSGREKKNRLVRARAASRSRARPFRTTPTPSLSPPSMALEMPLGFLIDGTMKVRSRSVS